MKVGPAISIWCTRRRYHHRVVVRSLVRTCRPRRRSRVSSTSSRARIGAERMTGRKMRASWTKRALVARGSTR